MIMYLIRKNKLFIKRFWSPVRLTLFINMSKVCYNLTFNKGHNKMRCISITLVRNGHDTKPAVLFWTTCNSDKSDLLAADHTTEQSSKQD